MAILASKLVHGGSDSQFAIDAKEIAYRDKDAEHPDVEPLGLDTAIGDMDRLSPDLKSSNLVDAINAAAKSGGGGGGGYSYIFCAKAPAEGQTEYDITPDPISYDNTVDSIAFPYYLTGFGGVAVTYKLIVSGRLIASGEAEKGSKAIQVPKRSLVGGSNVSYDLYLYANGVAVSVTKNKDGDIGDTYLRYNVSETSLSITYTSTSGSAYDFNRVASLQDGNSNNVILRIHKSENITVDSFSINSVQQSAEALAAALSASGFTYTATAWGLQVGSNELRIDLNYTIDGASRIYTNTHTLCVVSESIPLLVMNHRLQSDTISIYSPLLLDLGLATILDTTASLVYKIFPVGTEEPSETSAVTLYGVASRRITQLTASIPHNQSVAAAYTLKWWVEQVQGSSIKSTQPITETITIQSVEESSGPVMGSADDACLLMNFDINRTIPTDLTSSVWKSNKSDYCNYPFELRFFNAVSGTPVAGIFCSDSLGTTAREAANTGSVLSYQGDPYIRLFGDSYAELYYDNRRYDIANMQSELMKIPESESLQGYTIEVVIRTAFTGNIDQLALQISSLLSVSYSSVVSGLLAANVDFQENEWIHLTLVVNRYEDVIGKSESTPLSEAGSLQNHSTLVAHNSLYINGIIGKLKNDLSAISIPSGNVILNRNVVENTAIYGCLDLKVLRVYKRPLSPEEILRNYHSCITNLEVRQSEIQKNDLNNLPGITELYLVKNTGVASPEGAAGEGKVMRNANTSRNDGVENVSFSVMDTKKDKAGSKATVVNCTAILVSTMADKRKHVQVFKNVETTLQGTSTLAYIIKNYKIKLYEYNAKKGKDSKQKIALGNPIEGFNADGSYKVEWKKESKFTLKADYMESSHMNNTGFARFIHSKIESIGSQESPQDRRTPSQLDYPDKDLRIIIDGFPFIMRTVDFTGEQTTDPAASDYALSQKIWDLICECEASQPEADEFDYSELVTPLETIVNVDSRCRLLGSYMFNLDKEATANYGFEEEWTEEEWDQLPEEEKQFYPKSEGEDDCLLRYPYFQSLELNANTDVGAAVFLPYTPDRRDPSDKPYASEYDYYLGTYESRYVYTEEDYVDPDSTRTITIGSDSWDCVEVQSGEYVVPGFPLFRNIASSSDPEQFVKVRVDEWPDKTAYGYGTYFRALYSEDYLCLNGAIQLTNYLNLKNTANYAGGLATVVNVPFAVDYLIMAISAGMVDNLGKNIMINSWNLRKNESGKLVPFNPAYIDPNDVLLDSFHVVKQSDDTYAFAIAPEGHEVFINEVCQWYPSFYDLDTCLGLDNSGNESVPIEAEPLLEGVANVTFKDYATIYVTGAEQSQPGLAYDEDTDTFFATPDSPIVDSRLQDVIININNVPLSDYSDYKYLPTELVNLLYKINKGEIPQEVLNATSDFIWVMRFRGNGTSQVLHPSSIVIRSADWVVFNPSTYAVSIYTDQRVARYSHYPAFNSKLWNAMYSNYANTFFSRYSQLRSAVWSDSGDSYTRLSADSILKTLATSTFDAIPKNYYNYNALIKYFRACRNLSGNDLSFYCHMCNGDREVKVRQWLQHRLDFVDTVFKSELNEPYSGGDAGKELIIFSQLSGSPTIFCQTQYPQYISTGVDVKAVKQRKYVDSSIQDNPNYEGVSFPLTITAGQQLHLFGARNLMNFESFMSFVPSSIDVSELTKLKSLIIGSTDAVDTGVQSLTFAPSTSETVHGFNTLSVHCANKLFTSLSLDRCLNLETLDLSGCTYLSTLTLPQGSRLKRINLTNCRNLQTLVINDAFQLVSLTLTGCESLRTLQIVNAPQFSALSLSGSVPVRNIKLHDVNVSTLTLPYRDDYENVDIQGSSFTSVVFSKGSSAVASKFTSLSALYLAKCPNLRTVNMGRVSNIKSLTLPWIDDQSGTRTLHLAGCPQLTAVGYEGQLTEGVWDFEHFKGSNGYTVLGGVSFEGNVTYYTRVTQNTTIKNLKLNHTAARLFAQNYYNTENSGPTVPAHTINLENCDIHCTNATDMFACCRVGEMRNTTFSFASNLTTISGMFAACYASKEFIGELLTKIAEGSATTVTSAVGTFARVQVVSDGGLAYRLGSSFPGGYTYIFDPKLYRFTNLQDCTGIFALSRFTTVQCSSSAPLFPASVTNLSSAFAGSTDGSGLQTLSANLFENLTNVTSLKGIFSNCTKLTACPDIYAMAKVTNANGAFYGCSSLSYNMANLRENCTWYDTDKEEGTQPVAGDFFRISTYGMSKLQSAVGMYCGCSSLEGYSLEYSGESGRVILSCFPDSFFQHNSSLTDMRGMFQSTWKSGTDPVKGITTILPKYFVPKTVTDVGAVFRDTKISGYIPNEFLCRNTDGTSSITTLGVNYTPAVCTSGNALSTEASKNVSVNLGVSFVWGGIDVPLGGAFEDCTQLEGFEGAPFSGLSLLKSAQRLFKGCSQFVGQKGATTWSIPANFFEGCPLLQNVAFTFYNNRLQLPISPQLLENLTALLYIDGCFANNGQIFAGEVVPQVKISTLTNLISCQGLYYGDHKYQLDGNGGAEDSDNINTMFKVMPKLQNTSLMYANTDLVVTFEADQLFDPQGALTRCYAMFRQSTNNEGSFITYADDGNVPEWNNYLVQHIHTESSYQYSDIEPVGGITGRIPKYLFRDMLNIVSCGYMFAGTCVSGYIPKTIFDVSANHKTITRSYTGPLVYYQNPESSAHYDDPAEAARADDLLSSTEVYFYPDDAGEYYNAGVYPEGGVAHAMLKGDDPQGGSHYSMCDSFEYEEDVIDTTPQRKVFTLTSVDGMFAYCGRLSNGESSSTSHTDYWAPCTIPFAYNGWVPIDASESIDETEELCVVDWVSGVFRRYNPVTDAVGVVKYRRDNPNASGFDAVNIISDYQMEGKPSRVYAIHPDIFVNLPALTSVSSFITYNIRLQGCISNSLFLYNTKLKNANSFCSYCANLCGFMDGTGDNSNDVYNLFYIPSISVFSISNISNMFSYCTTLGKSSVTGFTSQLVQPVLVGNTYVRGFLAWQSTSGGKSSTLLHSLSSMAGLFTHCVNFVAKLPANFLSSTGGYASPGLNTDNWNGTTKPS